MDYTALLNEINAKCSASLVASRDTQTITNTVNTGRTKQAGVPISNFLGWAAQTGMRAVIEDAAHLSASPYYSTLRSSALAMLDIITNKTDLDLSASVAGQGNLAMLGAWVTAGAITAAQQSALVAMATVPDPVSELDVRIAIGG